MGDPEAVRPVDHETAGWVVVLASDRCVARHDAAVGGERDEPPAAFLRAVDLAARAAREPVHPVGVAASLGDGLARGIEAQQPPLVDRAEQNAVAIRDDAAGRAFVGTGDEVELPSHLAPPYQTGTPGILSRVRCTP